MKFRCILIFLFYIGNIDSQILMDSCGVDNKLELNTYEANYLDSTFSIPNITFVNKSVEFRNGNYGHFQITKNQYFLDVKNWLKDHGRIHEDIIILSETEKINYGIYDAIIISWSKISVTEKTRIKFLETIIKENHNVK